MPFTYATDPANVVTDKAGNALAGVHIAVYTARNGTPITSLVHPETGAAYPGVLVSDDKGRFPFRLEAETLSRVSLQDPSGEWWEVVANEAIDQAGLIVEQFPGIVASAESATTKADEATAATADLALAPRRYGAAGNGVADDTSALQAASTAAGSDKVIRLSGDYLISSSITFNASVVSDGATFRVAAITETPTIKITLAKSADLRNVHFVGVELVVAPGTDHAARINGGLFDHAALTLGTAAASHRDITVDGATFLAEPQRTIPSAIRIHNVSDVTVSNCKILNYLHGVRVTPSCSFASRGIVIEDCEITDCLRGVSLEGTSMHRVVRVSTRRTIITATDKGVTATDGFAVHAAFAHKLTVEDCTLRHAGAAINLEAVHDSLIRRNTSGPTSAAGIHTIKLFGCCGVTIADNRLAWSKHGYKIITLAGTSGPTVGATNQYPNRDLTIERNLIVTDGVEVTALRVDNCDNLRIDHNRFVSHNLRTGLMRIVGTTSGSYSGNTFTAPAGSSAAQIDGTAPFIAGDSQALVTRTAPTRAVAAPVITASDVLTNGAKSYVFTFTATDPTLIRQSIDYLPTRTISQHMAAAAADAPVLGWSSSSRNLGFWHDYNGDLIRDGLPYSDPTIPLIPGWYNRTLVVIDNFGRLTCRRYDKLQPLDRVVGLSAAIIDEGAWQIGNHWAGPIVVDGAAYSPVADGICTEVQYSVQISGRSSIGQRADGTFVVIVVDGATDVSGCTMQQLGAKHRAVGSVNAYNLDGGGSASLWYNGATINTPSDPAGERKITSVMYV